MRICVSRKLALGNIPDTRMYLNAAKIASNLGITDPIDNFTQQEDTHSLSTHETFNIYSTCWTIKCLKTNCFGRCDSASWPITDQQMGYTRLQLGPGAPAWEAAIQEESQRCQALPSSSGALSMLSARPVKPGVVQHYLMDSRL